MFVGTDPSPPFTRHACRREDLVELVRSGDPGGADRGDTGGRGCDGLDDLSGPRSVGGDRRIGVGSVDEVPGAGSGDDGVPVTVAMRGGAQRFDRCGRGPEPVLLPGEQFRGVGEVEHGRHEVLGAGALLESAHEVGDRNVELGGVHDGRVQHESANRRADGVGLAGSHAEEHLEVDPAVDPAVDGEQPGARRDRRGCVRRRRHVRCRSAPGSGPTPTPACSACRCPACRAMLRAANRGGTLRPVPWADWRL